MLPEGNGLGMCYFNAYAFLSNDKEISKENINYQDNFFRGLGIRFSLGLGLGLGIRIRTRVRIYKL